MSSEIIAAVIGLGASFLTFLLGRYYEKRDRGQRKIIETGVTSAELVNPNKLGPISVSVDKGFITGKRTDSGKLLPVKSAYNYVIGVSNLGLDDIERPEIDIILDDDASIVEVKVKSDTISQDKFEYKTDTSRPNYRRIIPEYLNRKDSIAITVISINNTSSACKVLIGGKGISHKVRTSSPEITSPTNSTNQFAWLFAGAIVFVALLLATYLPDIFPILTDSIVIPTPTLP